MKLQYWSSDESGGTLEKYRHVNFKNNTGHEELIGALLIFCCFIDNILAEFGIFTNMDDVKLHISHI